MIKITFHTQNDQNPIYKMNKTTLTFQNDKYNFIQYNTSICLAFENDHYTLRYKKKKNHQDTLQPLHYEIIKIHRYIK